MSNLDRVSEIKAKLDKYYLSVRWLIYRLFRDHGIDVSMSMLSHVLRGDKIGGPRSEEIIEACEQILAAYEAVYNREGA